MLWIDANVLQAGHTPAIPVYDDGSIWQHMSDALHQSLYRVLTLLIAVLPGILAFFVALLVFTASGAGISWILRRCLTWLKFDTRFARKERRQLGSIQLAHRHCGALLVLGVRPARVHYRDFSLRRLLCHRHAAAHFAAPVFHARGGRNPAVGGRNSDCALPGAIHSHRRGERAAAVRAHPVAGR